MLPTAQKLIEELKIKKKVITPDERRHCVGYLMATQPQMSVSEMSELFSVGDRTIRDDRKKIRMKMADEIRDEDPALLMADIQCDLRRQLRDIENSKTKSRLGSKEFLAHCVAIMNMRVQSAKLLQDLGFLPKNIGSMITEDYIWETIVNHDGSLETKRIHRATEKKTLKLPMSTGAEKKEVDISPDSEDYDYVEYYNGEGALPESFSGDEREEESQASQTDPTPATPEAV
jgi:hypothetical protein